LWSSDSGRAFQNEIDSSDPLAHLLSQLGDLSGEDANKMDGMIEEMLGAIMSKDVLYDPMKELSSAVSFPIIPYMATLKNIRQYPGYLSSHPDLPAEDKKRYEEQLRLSREILAIFDKPNYSDEDSKSQADVFKLMNEV
jgi:peroxin-19